MEKSSIKNYFLYFTLFVSGGVILIIEIAGTRILAPFFLIKLNQHLLVFSDKFGFKFGPLVSSALLFALPLLLLSMAGPFAIRLLSREREHSGTVSGMVFGISTVGSLAGALIAGFYLVPNFSLSNVFVFSVAAIMFISGSGLFFGKTPGGVER